MMQSVREVSQPDRRVCVSNLADEVKWHHLRDFMGKAGGEVLFADVLLFPNGMSKGCGIVEYATEEQAQRAILELSDRDLRGRRIYVRAHRELEPRFSVPRARGDHDGAPRSSGFGSYSGGASGYDYGTEGPRQLYISNLPSNISWQDLNDLFRQADQAGLPKGTGIVVFESVDDARNAVQQFNGYDWDGRILEVRFDKNAMAAGGPAYGGRRHSGLRTYAGKFGTWSAKNDRRGIQKAVSAIPAIPFIDQATGGGEPGSMIYVQNLPWSTTSDDLIELFTTIGKVQQAEVQYDSSGRSSGAGVVELVTAENAGAAISKFTNYQYGGRPLKLSYVKYQTTEDSSMWVLLLEDVPLSVEELRYKIHSIDQPSQDQLPQWLVLTWEVPQLISRSRLSDPERRVGSFTLSRSLDISRIMVISGAAGIYEASTTRQHLINHWPNVGAALLSAISDALAHMYEVRGCSAVGAHYSICALNTRLIFSFGEPVEDTSPEALIREHVIQALSWVCQALRPCSDSRGPSLHISQSTLYRAKTVLAVTLEPLRYWYIGPRTASMCWTALFSKAVVAEQDLSRTWGEGLELDFDLMMQLSGAENYVWLDDKTKSTGTTSAGGYIAIGFFTALLPTKRHPVEGVQWHLEFTEDEPISIAELSTKNIERVLIADMQEVSKSKCFLGWCENANIMLGTAKLPNTLSWSGLPQRSRSLHASGWNAGAQLQGSIGPIQAIGQVSRMWQLENVRQRFEPNATYAKAIQINSRQVALVFDVATKRAWLVPKLSLMLHLCHTYVRHFEDPGSCVQHPVPLALPSTDGALAAKEALSGQGDIVVFQHGTDHEDQIRLRNILVDISANMSKSLAAGERPRFLRALGPELMDMISEPGTGALLSEIPADHFLSSSANFAQLADSVYVCSNIGSAISPSAGPGNVACGCMTLEHDKGYLAVHLRCLEALLCRRNHNLQNMQLSALPIGDGGNWCHRPYVPCNHSGNSSFWAEPQRFVQSISRSRFRGRPLPVHKIPAATGAVVFGGADRIWHKLLDILRG